MLDFSRKSIRPKWEDITNLFWFEFRGLVWNVPITPNGNGYYHIDSLLHSELQETTERLDDENSSDRTPD